MAGDTVVVLGAGNIGLTAIAAARALGAGKIIATARHSHQAELAKVLGADFVVDPNDDGAKSAVYHLTAGLDNDATLVQAVDMTRVMGRIFVLGPSTNPTLTDWMKLHLKEQSILFSVCYGIMDGRHDFEMAFDLMASGKVDLKRIVTHTFPLREMPQAWATAYDKSTGSVKVQLHM